MALVSPIKMLLYVGLIFGGGVGVAKCFRINSSAAGGIRFDVTSAIKGSTVPPTPTAAAAVAANTSITTTTTAKKNPTNETFDSIRNGNDDDIFIAFLAGYGHSKVCEQF